MKLSEGETDIIYQVVFEVVLCGGITGSDVTRSDVSHMTGSDVSHVFCLEVWHTHAQPEVAQYQP
jgi:hypothetical protein